MSAILAPRRAWPDCCSYSITSSPTWSGTVYASSRGKFVGFTRKLESLSGTDENGVAGSGALIGDESSVDIGRPLSASTWRHLALLGTNPSTMRIMWPYFVPFQYAAMWYQVSFAGWNGAR